MGSGAVNGGSGGAGGAGGRGGLLHGNGGGGGNGADGGPGAIGGPGGAGGAGGQGSILFGHAGARGANGNLGASIGGGGNGDYSPYIDLSVYVGQDGYDFASASQAGVQNVTLAFIDADANGQPAWDGYTSQEINGGSQIAYINNQIANMHAAGINGTLSFGGDPPRFQAAPPICLPCRVRPPLRWSKSTRRL